MPLRGPIPLLSKQAAHSDSAAKSSPRDLVWGRFQNTSDHNTDPSRIFGIGTANYGILVFTNTSSQGHSGFSVSLDFVSLY